MKKIFLIILLISCGIVLMAQNLREVKFYPANVTGTDTAYFLPVQGNRSITVDFTNLTSTTDSVEIFTAWSRRVFVSITDITSSIPNPFACSKTTYSNVVNGITCNAVTFYDENPGLGFPFWIVKHHTNGAKTGYIKVIY